MAVRNIHHTREFQICASLPCHLSCGILRLSPRLLAAMVGKHQVQAVHWAAESITSLSLPGLQQKIKWGKKFDSKNNFLLYSFFFFQNPWLPPLSSQSYDIRSIGQKAAAASVRSGPASGLAALWRVGQRLFLDKIS